MENVYCFRCNDFFAKITDNAPRGMIYCLPCADIEEQEELELQQSIEENEDYYETIELIEDNS